MLDCCIYQLQQRSSMNDLLCILSGRDPGELIDNAFYIRFQTGKASSEGSGL